MKNLFFFLLVASSIIFTTSCDKEDEVKVYTATLKGSNEVPANASTATGTATLTLNPTTNVFTMSVTYSGVTATAMHIHKGAVGANGDVVFPISTIASPVTYTSTSLTAAQVADLDNGLFYLNIHSAGIPSGEIRGNFNK